MAAAAAREFRTIQARFKTRGRLTSDSAPTTEPIIINHLAHGRDSGGAATRAAVYADAKPDEKASGVTYACTVGFRHRQEKPG